MGPRNGSHILEKRKPAVPLDKDKVWTGPEGSRRLRLPDFITINT
jgi:hypothetical protein